MFLQETKEQHTFPYMSRWGTQSQKVRTRTVYHFLCDQCGSKFVREKGKTHKYSLTKTKTHFCETCVDARITMKVLHQHKKDRKQNRCGEQRICKHTGYVEIYVGPDYPYHHKRSRFKSYHWKRHHIYVMEQHLCRALQPGEVVHHIDGDKQNNDFENLDVMSIDQHNQCHGKAEQVVFALLKQGIVQYDRTTKQYCVAKSFNA